MKSIVYNVDYTAVKNSWFRMFRKYFVGRGGIKINTFSQPINIKINYLE